MDYFFLYSRMKSEKQKPARYERLYKQAEDLIRTSPSTVAKFATLNALLYHKIPYIFWVGFYLVDDKRLIVSAYQGPLACQVLSYPSGICWQSVIEKSPLLIPDVHKVPNHIACDSRAKSEIVIPLRHADGAVYGVLDVDSDRLNAFDKADQEGLTRLTQLL